LRWDRLGEPEAAEDVERPDGEGAPREPLDDVREEDGSDEDDGKTSRKEQAGHR
jgi:hypothetical protein